MLELNLHLDRPEKAHCTPRRSPEQVAPGFGVSPTNIRAVKNTQKHALLSGMVNASHQIQIVHRSALDTAGGGQ